MNWMQDMTARWVRILSAAGGGSTPLDEAAHQISEIGGMSGKSGMSGKKGRFSGLKRNAAASAEASGSRALPQDPERASSAGLGARVEQLLRLAEEQASALIDAARAEAAEITSPAGTQQPCPRCGAR
jgi:hypothetical protein